MAKHTITLTINGQSEELLVPSNLTLLHVLRDQLGLTGTKNGCEAGECGACTVLVDDVPLDSCLYLAVWVDGRSIRTAEGETKKGSLSAVQQAYLDTGAVQCGFCTPGLIMTSRHSWKSTRAKKRSPAQRSGALMPATCAAARAMKASTGRWSNVWQMQRTGTHMTNVE